MTLEQLMHNYRLAKENAARMGAGEARETYFDLVAYYAKRIRAVQGKAGRHSTDWLDDDFTGTSRG